MYSSVLSGDLCIDMRDGSKLVNPGVAWLFLLDRLFSLVYIGKHKIGKGVNIDHDIVPKNAHIIGSDWMSQAKYMC